MTDPQDLPDAWAHATATIDDGATMGPGTKVWHYSHISSGARIGARCVFGQNTYVAPGVEIGDGVKVQNNVSLYTGVIVEDDVFLGPSCVLTNVVNPRSHVERKDEFRTTRLRRGATIGANATVVCGVELGTFSLVGAGAVVTRDVPAYAQVIGTPARIVGWRCHCGEKLAREIAGGLALTCDACGATYAADDATTLRRTGPDATRD